MGRVEGGQEGGGIGQVENGFPCRFRKMDFLNIPAETSDRKSVV